MTGGEGSPCDRGPAVVLGASGGIGSTVARRLRAEGWNVVAHGHRGRPEGEGAVQADLTSWSETEEVAAEAIERFGVPELVVNAAGVRDDGLFVVQSPSRWMEALVANVATAYHPTRAFVPAMARARRGSVVNVVSVAARTASPGQTSYAAAKAAIVAMTTTLAAEYGRRGLRFNAVAPGFVDTPMTDAVDRRVRDAIEARQALPGTVAPDDVATTVVMLAATPSITGQVLAVDRGVSL